MPKTDAKVESAEISQSNLSKAFEELAEAKKLAQTIRMRCRPEKGRVLALSSDDAEKIERRLCTMESLLGKSK